MSAKIKTVYPKWLEKARETLNLIREESYNLERPSDKIIRELVDVIRLLDRRG
jgi:hypothetical protein